MREPNDAATSKGGESYGKELRLTPRQPRNTPTLEPQPFWRWITSNCRACGSEFTYLRKTKPRLYCEGCSPAKKPVQESRPCERCGRPATSSRHWFCDECRAAGARRRYRRSKRSGSTNRVNGKTTDRGYGQTHQRIRAFFARAVNSGQVLCSRCGQLIAPGEPWDLGHLDGDRSRYSGPEHRRCNRATAGRRRKSSRPW